MTDVVEQEPDYTYQNGVAPTALQARFAAWLQSDAVGYDPSQAKSKKEAFEEGVRYAVALRIPYQASEHNKLATEEERAQRQQEKEEREAAKAKAKAEREAAAAAKAAPVEQTAAPVKAAKAAKSAAKKTAATPAPTPAAAPTPTRAAPRRAAPRRAPAAAAATLAEAPF